MPALRRVVAAFIALLVPSAAAAAVPHITNDAAPRESHVVMELRELWQRGHDDDDLIFGSISSVQTGPDGGIYVLDQQLSQVCVFDDNGELLRILSREGEGPGETRQPEHMVFFPDGSLGLVQYINGRIVRIGLDGTPLAMLMPPGSRKQGGGIAAIRRARSRAGVFVINGASVTPTEDGMLRTQYLVRCNEEGEPQFEYLSLATSSQLMRDGWIERDNYFPSHERWDIDARGRVLAAAERNAYRINVYGPDGQVAFTFGREGRAWRRTSAQKQEIRDSLVVLRDGQRMEVNVDVEDDDPMILELHARPDGEVWVLPSRGRHEQDAGIMQTYDVFDEGGAFLRQVAVACAGDPEEDRLFFLDGNRIALVRGAVQARRNTFGGSRGEEPEIAIHDLKIFAY